MFEIMQDVQKKYNNLSDKNKYRCEIYCNPNCAVCDVKADIFHITTSCQINTQLQISKIRETQKIIDDEIGKNKINMSDWLDTTKYSHIPRNKRKNIISNIQLLNIGFITKAFTSIIKTKSQSKQHAQKILTNVQFSILKKSKLMYKKKHHIFFNQLKRDGKYQKTYHHTKKRDRGIT